MSLKALVPACILLLAAAGCSPKTVCCGEIRADRLTERLRIRRRDVDMLLRAVGVQEFA